MKQKNISRFFGFFLSLSFLIAPIPLTAFAENIIQNLSEIECEAIVSNRDITYVYLGEELSNIQQIITRVIELDDHAKSPLTEFNQHIAHGFFVGKQDVVLESLRYAELVVQHNIKKNNNNDLKELCNDLDLLITKIVNGELTIDATLIQPDAQNEQSLYDMLVKRGPGDFIVNNNLIVLGKTYLKKHLHTKQGAHIEGKLQVDKQATFKHNLIVRKLLSAAQASIAELLVQQLSITNQTVTGTLSVNNAVIAHLTLNNNVSLTDITSQNSTIIDSFTLKYLTTSGILHNNGSGNVTSSLIVNNDITNSTITNNKLATISSTNIPGNIVVRDGSGNFSTNMITILGTPANATDVATKAYVDAQIGGGGTNLNQPNTVVKRDITGSFAAQVVSATDTVVSGTMTLTPFNTAGIVHNNSSGLFSTSLVLNGDIANGTITNAKMATISSTATPGNIVVYDGSGHISASSITLINTPTNPTDAATIAYVNSVAGSGLVVKAPAVVVDTNDTALSGLQTIDGVTLNANDRVLLVGQINPIQNGLWLAQVGVWTRPADFANGSTVQDAYVLILSGNVNGGSSWLANTPTAIVGTDPIGFTLFSLPNQTTGANVGAGTGLIFRDKTGAVLNFKSLIASNHIDITDNANDIAIATDATDANAFDSIVARDALGNFSTNMITIVGTTTNPTDVATKAYVDAQMSGGGTNLNQPNTVVKRDSTGSFAAQVVSAADSVLSGNLILNTEPSTPLAGNIIKGGSSFIHDFGTNNTFVGIDAGNFTTSGLGNNTSLGFNTLTFNTTGQNNTAIGTVALQNNTTGQNNVAVGNNTLTANTGGFGNTAIGSGALPINSGGTINTAVGIGTLSSLVSGDSNIAIGNLSGSSCTSNESFNIYIGNVGVVGENSTIRIGASAQNAVYIAGIIGTTSAANAVPVLVDTNNKLGTAIAGTSFYQTQTLAIQFNPANPVPYTTPQGSPTLISPVTMTKIGTLVMIEVGGQTFSPSGNPVIYHAPAGSLPAAFCPPNDTMVFIAAFDDLSQVPSGGGPVNRPGCCAIYPDGTIDIWSQAFDNTSTWTQTNTGWMDFTITYNN